MDKLFEEISGVIKVKEVIGHTMGTAAHQQLGRLISTVKQIDNDELDFEGLKKLIKWQLARFQEDLDNVAGK